MPPCRSRGPPKAPTASGSSGPANSTRRARESADGQPPTALRSTGKAGAADKHRGRTPRASAAAAPSRSERSINTNTKGSADAVDEPAAATAEEAEAEAAAPCSTRGSRSRTRASAVPCSALGLRTKRSAAGPPPDLSAPGVLPLFACSAGPRPCLQVSATSTRRTPGSLRCSPMALFSPTSRAGTSPATWYGASRPAGRGRSRGRSADRSGHSSDRSSVAGPHGTRPGDMRRATGRPMGSGRRARDRLCALFMCALGASLGSRYRVGFRRGLSFHCVSRCV